MSIYVQNYIWSLNLTPTTKFVAIALADHAHDNGREARPSQEYLSQKTGLSVRHIRRCLKDLTEAGIIFVERQPSRGRCTVYGFSVPEGGFGRSGSPVRHLIGRTPEPDGRTFETEWADGYAPLTIKNPHDNQNSDLAKNNEAAKAAIAAIRAQLGRAPR